MANLARHLRNVREVYGIPCVVALNRFPDDTDAEVTRVVELVEALGVSALPATHFVGRRRRRHRPGQGRPRPARADRPDRTFSFTYPDDVPLKEKAETLAHRLYGASSVTWDGKAKRRLDRLEADGYGHLPVCIAKTQYSFSTDATLRGAPTGHDLHVREVRLSAGAGFVVLVCGDVMTMPGLPVTPAASKIDLLDDGTIVGLS